MDITRVFEAVLRERAYQDQKWGSIDEHAHTVGEWLLILERELFEAKEAWCKGRGDAGALCELVQVVAVGVACLEQHGAVARAEAMLPALDGKAWEMLVVQLITRLEPARPALAGVLREALRDYNAIRAEPG